MGYTAQGRDLTSQYRSYGRILSDYRPQPGVTYNPGNVVGIAPQDLQVAPDAATIQLGGNGVIRNMRLVGCVSETWPGFANQGPGLAYSFTAPPANPAIRGTQGVLVVVRGFHPAITITSGGGSPNIVDGTILIPGSTQGMSWGSAAIPARGYDQITAIAMLPKTGPITSIPGGTGAYADASKNLSIGTLSPGDAIILTLTLPNGDSRSWQIPVTSTSTTIMATAILAVLNADAWFTTYFVATAAPPNVTFRTTPKGVMMVPYPNQYGETHNFQLSNSGAIANLDTCVITKIGPGNTNIAVVGGPNFTAGALYQGVCPAFIIGGLC